MSMSGSFGILVADVGGTNTRVALARGKRLVPDTVQRYKNVEFASLEDIIESYRETRPMEISGACLAVAGPISDGIGELTNVKWRVDAAEISRRLGVPVSVVNDLQALGHAVHLLTPSDLSQVAKGVPGGAHGTGLVVNAGTGFNAVAVHDTVSGRIVRPSEAGHATMPVTCDEDVRLRTHLLSRSGFACIEDVLSGRGYETVKAWVTADRDDGCDHLAKPFDAETSAARILARILGTTTGDLALVHLPYAGIYLTGGIVTALASDLVRLGFLDAFLNKGRFGKLMKSFDVHVICDDLAALRGCASCYLEEGTAWA